MIRFLLILLVIISIAYNVLKPAQAESLTMDIDTPVTIISEAYGNE